MQIIINGVGGQGVIFITQIIAEASLLANEKVICAESHGMAQRGGSVICFAKIGDYLSGLVKKKRADIGICFKKTELQASLPFLSKNSTIFLNAENGFTLNNEVNNYIKANEMKLFTCDADGLASSMKFTRGANQLLLGFSVALNKNFLSKDKFIMAIKNLSHKVYVNNNINAFLEGYKQGKAYRCAVR